MNKIFLMSLLRRGAWAPILVVGIYALLAIFIGRDPRLDPYFHLAGGIAIAHFFNALINLRPDWFGPPSKLGKSFSVFCMAITAAVFWEFLEFGMGQGINIQMQFSLSETMADLALGSGGAFIYIFLNQIIRQ